MNFIPPGSGCQPGGGAKIKALRPPPVSMVTEFLLFRMGFPFSEISMSSTFNPDSCAGYPS